MSQIDVKRFSTSKHLLTSKSFWRQTNCWGQKIYWRQKIVDAKKVVDVKKRLTSNNASTSKKFDVKNFLTSKCFWRQNMYDVKPFFSMSALYKKYGPDYHKDMLAIASKMQAKGGMTKSKALALKDGFLSQKWCSMDLTLHVTWDLNFQHRVRRNIQNQNPKSNFGIWRQNSFWRQTFFGLQKIVWRPKSFWRQRFVWRQTYFDVKKLFDVKRFFLTSKGCLTSKVFLTSSMFVWRQKKCLTSKNCLTSKFCFKSKYEVKDITPNRKENKMMATDHEMVLLQNCHDAATRINSDPNIKNKTLIIQKHILRNWNTMIIKIKKAIKIKRKLEIKRMVPNIMKFDVESLKKMGKDALDLLKRLVGPAQDLFVHFQF